MKKINIFFPVVLLSALLILSACGGEEKAQFSINVDGYGRTALSNGITFLVNHDETTSLSAGRILIGGGVLTETAENSGITNMMTRMILKGNDQMTAAEINEQLDFLGANVSSGSYKDYSAISFISLTENFDAVLEIISQSLLTPSFPDEELTKLKHEIEGSIKASNDNQSQASSRLFWKTAYGDKAYGLTYNGTIESIANITIDGIRNHYNKYVGGNNIIVSMSTDLSADKALELAQNKFANVKAEAEKVAPPVLTLQDESNGFISFDRNQSFIYMGFMLNHLQPSEVASVILLNEIMGANVGSRLWYLRQKEKLAYAVYTQYSNNKHCAFFRAAIGTDTSKVSLALSSLNREFDQLIADGITADELTDAKVNMKNNLIFSIDKKSNRANNMAYYECIGYNYKFNLDLIKMADKITLDEVNNFVKSNFTDDRKFTSIVGKQ
jgi:zinc protease